MKTAYSPAQLKAMDLLGEGVPADVLDEVMAIVNEAEQTSTAQPKKEDTELTLKMKLLNETDWRKRAALSAMLISKSFD